ncbi:MAG TPA: hypothetical protein VIV65_09400 [Gemmatimonadaceae bacterium]|jgi:hypothetical protein
MSVSPAQQRTLAIDPMCRGFAYVVFEGSERLLDWGTTDFRHDNTTKRFLARVAKVIDICDPSLVVVEVTTNSRRGTRAREWIRRLVAFVRRRGITVQQVTRADVQESFRASGTGKWEIATAVARLLPDLETRLPHKRKPWTTEDERMNIFDAASFALVALREREQVARE